MSFPKTEERYLRYKARCSGEGIPCMDYFAWCRHQRTLDEIAAAAARRPIV